MADHNSKENQRRRFVRSIKKMRTREEEKELKRSARVRKAQHKKGRRENIDPLDEDAAVFEKIRRGKSTSAAPSDASEDWRRRMLELVRDPTARSYEACVLSVSSGRARVIRAGDGELRDVRLPRELARVQQSEIAVGDEVEIISGDGEQGVVRAVLPRSSVLVRPDPGNPNRERVLAANVDRAIVVLSLRTPPLHPGLLDRYLVALERGGVEAVVCVNKCDLAADRAELAQVADMLEPYERLGIATVCTSAVEGLGIDELARLVAGRTCVFTGHSGVGKSALLNALDPTCERRTSVTSDSSGRGRHTTTSSTLTVLRDGTRVIDTPGVRELGLWRVARDELRLCFGEFTEPARGCRFRDCLHVDEPDCGVRDAVERGDVAQRRYESYLRILSTLD